MDLEREDCRMRHVLLILYNYISVLIKERGEEKVEGEKGKS
jgi:hypothetical protein